MPNNKKNILVFMTDQQRGSTLVPGHRLQAHTPNLDRFREESVQFDQCYCPAPHCCPSRASFFTGLMPTQHGVWNNVNVQNRLSSGPNEGTPFWSQDFINAGYQLDYNGKWHVSAEYGPADLGWTVHSGPPSATDFYAGIDHIVHNGLSTPLEQRQDGQIQRPGYMNYQHYGTSENPFDDEDHIDSAVAVIRNRSNKQPWLHYIGTLGPHDPYIPPQRFLDLYDADTIELPPSFHDTMEDKPALYRKTRAAFDQLSAEEHRKAIHHYLAFCSYEDYLFGRVLEALKETNSFEDTIIVYCSDHGDYVGDHGLWCKGLPCFEGAYEIPLLIRSPEHLAQGGRMCHEFTSLCDFGPTLLDLAEVKTESSFAGRSLRPLIEDRIPNDWRQAIFTQSNGNELYGIQRSIRTTQWKLVYNGFDYDELYDLKNDPEERYNVARDPKHRAIIEALYQQLWRFAIDHNETCFNSYIMVGHAQHGPACATEHSA